MTAIEKSRRIMYRDSEGLSIVQIKNLEALVIHTKLYLRERIAAECIEGDMEQLNHSQGAIDALAHLAMNLWNMECKVEHGYEYKKDAIGVWYGRGIGRREIYLEEIEYEFAEDDEEDEEDENDEEDEDEEDDE